MLKKFAESIVPNVSLLQGNSIENKERVSFGVVSGTNVVDEVQTVDWTDSIIRRCRFNSNTVVNSSFERVAILDCDLSGVVFSNCLLRECLFMGVSAKFQLVFENCILDRVMVARSRLDRFDIHDCKIVDIEFLGLELAQLDFRQCEAHKRKGRVSIEDCEIQKVGGLEQMSTQGVSVHVDATMWRDLGDYYVRERGIEQLAGAAPTKYGLLDEIDVG